MKKLLAFIILAFSATTLANAQIALLAQFEQDVDMYKIKTNYPTTNGWGYGTSGSASSSGFMVPSDNATRFYYTNDDKLGGSGNKSNEIVVFNSVLTLKSLTKPTFNCNVFFQGLSKDGKTEKFDIVYDTWFQGKTADQYAFKPVPGGVVTGAANWQQISCNLTSIKNDQIVLGFRYNDDGAQMGGVAIDDVAIIDVVNGSNLTLRNVTGLGRFMEKGNYEASGTVLNSGSEDVTAFSINWSINGGETKTMAVTDYTLKPAGVFSFTHPDMLAMNTKDEFEIHVWLSDIQASDNNADDNDLTYLVSTVDQQVERHSMVEEFTNAYCQFCPRGAISMRELLKSNPNVIGIAYHSKFLGQQSDRMTIPEADELDNSYGAGQPTAVVDRYFAELSDNVWSAAVDARADMLTPVAFEIEKSKSSYDEGTRELKIAVKANFLTKISDEVRIGFLFVENDLTGSGGGWDQVNAYAGRNDIPELKNLGNPIKNYLHQHVFRGSINGLWGIPGSIDTEITDGLEYTYELTTTIPENFWDAKTQVVSFVAMYNETGSREILNAREVEVSDLGHIGVAQTTLPSQLSIYPVPTNGELNIAYNGEKALNIAIVNIAGQTVVTDVMPQGQSYHNMDLSHLNAGVYMVTINDGASEVVKKVVLN